MTNHPILPGADEGAFRHRFTTKTGRQADTATASPTSMATITFYLTHPGSDRIRYNHKFPTSFPR